MKMPIGTLGGGPTAWAAGRAKRLCVHEPTFRQGAANVSANQASRQ